MRSISVVIPSYKNPKYLGFALEQYVRGRLADGGIVAVIDGYAEMYSEVIEKYRDIEGVRFIVFGENYGMPSALNQGVYAADSKLVLIVNEDNVPPVGWDIRLVDEFNRAAYPEVELPLCLSVASYEPHPNSFFGHPHVPLGESIEAFSVEEWHRKEAELSTEEIRQNGACFPFVLPKWLYLSVGGFDEAFPSAFVVDDDFFVKLTLLGVSLPRTYRVGFYHFGSKSTKKREGGPDRDFHGEEVGAAHHFIQKWGFRCLRDEQNMIRGWEGVVR